MTTPSPQSGRHQAEERALKISILGTLAMAALGVVFAFITGSQAILLDGMFSSTTLIMSVLTLRVSRLIRQPDDENFPFGYGHFEPLLNVIKSLLILVLCLFALFSAGKALLDGGRELALGIAVAYGAIAGVGCLVVALVLRRYARRTSSSLVAVDAKNWLIDTLMSGAVLIVFVAAAALRGSRLDDYLVYLDPLVVGILVLLALPVPVRILWENGKEFLLMAPSQEIQDRVDRAFREALADVDIRWFRLRVIKTGRWVNVMAHVLVGERFRLSRVRDLDRIRDDIAAKLADEEPKVVTTVLFMEDERWIG